MDFCPSAPQSLYDTVSRDRLSRYKSKKNKKVINAAKIIKDFGEGNMTMFGERVLGCLKEAIKDATILFNLKSANKIYMPPVSQQFEQILIQFYDICDVRNILKPHHNIPKVLAKEEEDAETIATLTSDESLDAFISRVKEFLDEFVESTWVSLNVVKVFDFVENIPSEKELFSDIEDLEASELDIDVRDVTTKSATSKDAAVKNAASKDANVKNVASKKSEINAMPSVDDVTKFNLYSVEKLLRMRCSDCKYIFISDKNKTSFDVLDNMRDNQGLSREYLSNFLRTLFRKLRVNPQLEDFLLTNHTNLKSALDFISEFELLKTICEKKFSMNPVEDFARKLYIKHSLDRSMDYKKLSTVLENEKKRVIRDSRSKLRQLDENIRHFRLEADMAQKLLAETLTRLKDEHSYHLKQLQTESEEKMAIRNRISTLMKTTVQTRADNWTRESELRQIKYKINEEIEEMKIKLYRSIATFDSEIEGASAGYRKQQMAIKEMEDNYYPLIDEFNKIQADALAKLAKEEGTIRDATLRNTSAIKIQNWWRSYRIKRKSVAPKKKIQNSVRR